jgi:AbiV family abortive infection protein
VADHSKRKYRNTLEFVESGFRACWENALDLNAASQKLHDGGFHATGLSLSVLALEELGKLTAIDGLLFSRQDDYKSAAFLKANRSHASKLAFSNSFLSSR